MASTSNSDFIIGIDLGTTYSCVSAFQDGKVTIFDDELGNKTVASCVSFTEKDFLVGHGAKNLAKINPDNTIYDVKRIIGRSFDDPQLQKDMKHFSFKISPNAQNEPLIQAKFKGQDRHFKPEQISALVLQQLRKMAEARLGFSVSKAVITVPAYYGDAQRAATIAAGAIAGLDVVKIINEPTAAAFAYGLKQNQQSVDNAGQRNILVFDLGGGTFDVSILQLTGNDFKVLSTSGDDHLGGEDVDTMLMRFVMHSFKTKQGVDLENNHGAMARLKAACEQAKISLSSQLNVTIAVDNIVPGQDLEVALSRARFDQLCAKLFEATLAPVKRALDEAKVSKTQISDVVMVGGSTRIPGIQKVVSDFFDGKALSKSINPDEAVSIGAAIQAATLSKHATQQMGKDGVIISDVIPLDLGIKLQDGRFSVLLARNTPIPARNTNHYVTSLDNQTIIIIDILEGVSGLAAENTFLGTMKLDGVPPKPKGQVSFDIEFSFDENGILRVNAHATNVTDGSIHPVNISFPKRAQLSPEQIILLEADTHILDTTNDAETGRQPLQHIADNSPSARLYETCKRCINRMAAIYNETNRQNFSDNQSVQTILAMIDQYKPIFDRNEAIPQDQLIYINQNLLSEHEMFLLELKSRQFDKGLRSTM